MITLIKGDKLFTDDTLIVFESGSYEPTSLVLVNKINNDIPKYQYQANYIKYGEIL